jgi:hypothetical protein
MTLAPLLSPVPDPTRRAAEFSILEPVAPSKFNRFTPGSERDSGEATKLSKLKVKNCLAFAKTLLPMNIKIFFTSSLPR